MKGDGVRQGEVAGAAVTDIAPTILYLMGIPIPGDMDGHVLTQAFAEEHLRANPVKLSAVTLSADGKGGSSGKDDKKEYKLSDDEEAIIEKNLRSLGYI